VTPTEADRKLAREYAAQRAEPDGDYFEFAERDFLAGKLNEREQATAPLLAELEATLDWLSSFSMPPTSTIQEKQERMAAIEWAIARVKETKS
jgi:hypothetical protein